MAKKSVAANDLPTKEQLNNALASASEGMEIEELITRLQTLQKVFPKTKIILSKDGEGNDFKPLYQIGTGTWTQQSPFSGDISTEDGAEPNALVLWPI